MESFSRILPISRAKFPEPLRSQLLFSPPLVLDEDCSASYVIRTSHSYTHNPTRAAVAITPSKRLVVWAMGAKKMDVPLEDPRWLGGIMITADKEDRLVFNIQMGVYGTGTKGDSLEIKVKTKQAEKLAEIAQTAMTKAGYPQPSTYIEYGQQGPAPTPMSAPGAPYNQLEYTQNHYAQVQHAQNAQQQPHSEPAELSSADVVGMPELPTSSNSVRVPRKPVGVHRN